MTLLIKRFASIKGIVLFGLFIASLFIAGDTLGKVLVVRKLGGLLDIERVQYQELQNELLTFEERADSLNSLLSTFEKKENRVRLIYGLSPINSEERQLGVGGLPSVGELAKRELDHYEVSKALKLRQIAQHQLRKINYTDSILQRVGSQVDKEITYQNELPSIWPVVGRVTSPYGFRPHPILAMRKFHDGIDIKGPMWMDVHAPADGVVAFSGWRKGYGKMVEISHRGTNLYTRYGHLADMLVKEGDVVKRGDVIAKLGNSGRSTGPHVHYEIRKENRGGGTRNPRLYLPDTTIIFD